jgi:hypothetical protein
MRGRRKATGIHKTIPKPTSMQNVRAQIPTSDNGL